MNLDNLRKLIPLLQKNESVIVNSWVNSSTFKEILDKHIVPEYFSDNYAHPIFRYFINVIQNHSKIGDCPAMRKFLQDCSLKNFEVEDVYKICANLRHAISYFLIENNLMSKIVYQEINYVLDENLSGILSLYTQMLKEDTSIISNQQQWIDQYTKVIENILIVSKADITGKIVYVNDKFVKISGYSRHELIGQPHSIVRQEDMPKAVFKNMWTTILDKKPWSGVMKNRKKDGTTYYVSTIILPILDNDGNILEFLSSRTDITELFNLQNEKEKREELLIKQSTLAEMGYMISLITHQWKQPLSAISSTITNMMVRSEIKDGLKHPNIKEFNQINHLVQHLSETIDDFQSFLQPDKKKETLKSDQIINNVYSLAKARLDSLNVEFLINTTDSFEITLFKNNLKQVLLNIFNNAADILEEKKVKKPQLNISFEESDNIGKIIIADNGGGIPTELLPDKLFELYETTKGDKGTGIGLQLCKLIIEEKFFGKIYAENKNDGATFTIELPLD